MVGPYPVDRQLSNGVEAVTVGIVDILSARSDTEVHVITAVFDGRDETVERNGITIHIIGSSNLSRRITFYRSERKRIARKLRELAPDIVHAQGANFYGNGALASNLPTVVTLHGMLFREASIVDSRSSLLRRTRTRVNGYFNARFEKKVLERAPRIITINNYVNRCIEGRTNAALHAISNPIDDSFFNIPKMEEDGRILCVARIEPRKGQLHLVNAVHQMKKRGIPVHLRVVGKIVDDHYADAVRAAIEQHGLADNVVFTGIVSDEELLDEYARASIVVMASREETSPMAFQQAMACGTPVVGPSVAGIPFLVEDGVTGVLVHQDDVLADGLAKAIGRLLEDTSLREQLGQNGRRTAESLFRSSRVGQQTVDVYHEMLNGAPIAHSSENSA